MKKYLFIAFLFAALAIMLCGCSQGNSNSSDKSNQALSPERIYAQSLNEALSEFNDCAARLTTALKAISPSDISIKEEQINDISQAADALTAACQRVRNLGQAPQSYYMAAQLMEQSMLSWEKAMEKCKELMELYRSMNGRFTANKDPVAEATSIKQQAEAIYSELAAGMKQATIQFHDASNAFNVLA